MSQAKESSPQAKKELFEFSLLPPKSKVELAAEFKRGQMVFYAVVVPVACLAIGLAVFILNIAVVDPSEANWQKAVDSARAELSNPDNQLGQLKVRNGELKVKTDFIAEPVNKNVDFEEVFTITDAVFEGNSSRSVITSYGRESTGEFLVNATSPNEAGPEEILTKFKSQEKVLDPNLLLVQRSAENNNFRFTISFNINQLVDATTN